MSPVPMSLPMCRLQLPATMRMIPVLPYSVRVFPGMRVPVTMMNAGVKARNGTLYGEGRDPKRLYVKDQGRSLKWQ